MPIFNKTFHRDAFYVQLIKQVPRLIINFFNLFIVEKFLFSLVRAVDFSQLFNFPVILCLMKFLYTLVKKLSL